MLKNEAFLGQIFGRLKVMEILGKNKNYQFVFRCICDCGNIKDVVRESLTSGRAKSCGCYNMEILKARKGTRLSEERRLQTIEQLRLYWEKEEKCPKWVGDKVEYQGIHQWLRTKFGNATHCENDIAHKAKKYQWANISGVYRRLREDFKMLCPYCHKKLDYGNYCKNRHPLFGDNCRIEKNGKRTCKICKNEWQKKQYYLKKESK